MARPLFRFSAPFSVPALAVLAPRALAVTAEAVDVVELTAALAAVDRDTEVAGTAVDDGIDDLFVLFWQVWVTSNATSEKDQGAKLHFLISMSSENKQNLMVLDGLIFIFSWSINYHYTALYLSLIIPGVFLM